MHSNECFCLHCVVGGLGEVKLKEVKSESITLLKAIHEGKKDASELPSRCGSEEDFIRYSVARFIWKQFENVDITDSVQVLEALQKVTT